MTGLIALAVDLQDGFSDDIVLVKINNEEIFRKEHVTSDLRIGLATRFTTNLGCGEVQVQVTIPTKNLTGKYKFIMNSKTHLGISITEPDSSTQKVSFLQSQEPFSYF
jgi:hypothetical protein